MPEKITGDSIPGIWPDVVAGVNAAKSGRRVSSWIAYRPWALETNVLYWAMLRPNVGVEYTFAPRWSANLDFDIAWWRQRSKDRFYQIWTLSPEVRYWFKGYGACRTFYVGAHFLSGSYDLKNGRTGYWNESLAEAGLSAGYALRLDDRWAFVFGVGVGYLHTRYQKYIRHYEMGEHYVYDGTGQTSYWGLTRAEASVRWNFGKKK